MSKYTIGIDLGGTTMTAGLVNEKFEVVGKVTWATRLPRPAQDLEKALADLCRTVARENKVDFADIRYVGIGTPGSVNFTTGKFPAICACTLRNDAGVIGAAALENSI